MGFNGTAEARPPRKRGIMPVIAALGPAERTPVNTRNHGRRVVLRAGLLFFLLGVACASADEPKRVLLVHSFGSAAPPFSVHSTAFERALVERMHGKVDLDEVSLDMARYSDPEMQEAIVEYLQKRETKWRPDLVVPIGSPAGVFVAKYRDKLFPDVPILYTSLDQRLLLPGALEKNAAYIGQVFDVPALIEDMLRVAPATKNIAVVIGSSPLEKYWKEAFGKAAEPYAGRIAFTYYGDLSFDQMLGRVAMLPPNSYIFLLLLLRDSAGITPNADEALKRLHDVANAPINSIFEHQLGLGIVGGRLYQGELIGREAADMAARILDGEPASSFSPRLIDPLPPRYDWRELERWKIDEKKLPPRSTILFRPPTAWEQHRDWIIGGASVVLLEALLIAALLANLIKRRRAERWLTESEERFRAMADAAPVLMWVTGPDKLCTFLNWSWLKFTGRNLDQEIGIGWVESVHPEDRKRCLETFATAFDRREDFVMQYRLRRHDGEYRTITDNGLPRYDVQDKFLGYIGACVDITDLLRQQEALHESEERVALAAEAAQLGVWEMNEATGKLWASDKIRELFQLPRDGEVTYADFQARVHPEVREERDEAIRKAIETDTGYENEFRILLPDGKIRWLAGRARCLNNNGHGGKRLLGVSMDITKSKEAEDLFRLATEASPSGTILVDKEGRIILVNAHIEELFGYTRDELIGQLVDVLVPERFATILPAHRAKFLDAPRAQVMAPGQELFGLRKDGSEFLVEVGLNPITTERGILVLATVVDISARKAAEKEARHQREQVELLGRAGLLGEMTASLAHELNQPLSAIVSNADAAMYYLKKADLDREQLHEIMADVVADAGRAHDIIQGVRNSVKKGTAPRRRIDLNELVEKVMRMVQHETMAHSCKVQTSLAQDLPAIEGDPTQLQQVVINLVNNAVEAVRDVPADRRGIRIATQQNGNGEVRVDVCDTGPGFSETERARIFEHFYTTKKDGLGMGLAIVHSIVKAHRGTIEAENIQGGGARFSVHLPVSTRTDT